MTAGLNGDLPLNYSGPIPQLGLGTTGRYDAAGTAALLKAIEIGYRHLDTAQNYGTERQVGEAMRGCGLPRSDLFVTTKVSDSRLDKRQFMPSVEQSLETIGVDQVDLLLIHWPSQGDAVPFEDYMLALAEAKASGHARLIGVSNFPIALLERTRALLGEGAIATNQVEIHAYLQAPKLTGWAREHGLTLTAYQPLAKGELRDDPILTRIGEKHSVTGSAVALAFLMQQGHVVIPASSSEQHLRDNFAARGCTLDEADMRDIRSLDRGYRRINPAKAPRWDD